MSVTNIYQLLSVLSWKIIIYNINLVGFLYQTEGSLNSCSGPSLFLCNSETPGCCLEWRDKSCFPSKPTTFSRAVFNRGLTCVNCHLADLSPHFCSLSLCNLTSWNPQRDVFRLPRVNAAEVNLSGAGCCVVQNVRGTEGRKMEIFNIFSAWFEGWNPSGDRRWVERGWKVEMLGRSKNIPTIQTNEPRRQEKCLLCNHSVGQALSW